MNHLQKIPLFTALGSAVYGAISTLNYHVKCRSYSDAEAFSCRLYKLTRKAGDLYEVATGRSLESSELYDKSQQFGRELCTPFEGCEEMAEGVNTTLVSAALVCAVSLLALYIITKIKPRVDRQLEVRQVPGRARRARWESPSQPSSSHSQPAAPQSASSSSSQQPVSHQREWEARRNWVRNGADLSGIPGCKRS